jgi:hypothetical protein
MNQFIFHYVNMDSLNTFHFLGRKVKSNTPTHHSFYLNHIKFILKILNEEVKHQKHKRSRERPFTFNFSQECLFLFNSIQERSFT